MIKNYYKIKINKHLNPFNKDQLMNSYKQIKYLFNYKVTHKVKIIF